MLARALILVATLLSACGSPTGQRVCTGGAVGPLLTGAERLEVRVFDGSIPCAEAPLTTNAALSLDFARGTPLTFKLSAGRYTLLVTTFADDAGTQRLGQGCMEAQVGAGAKLCFDVPLSELTDGGGDLSLDMPSDGPPEMPPPDLAMRDMRAPEMSIDMAQPPDMACCASVHGTCQPDCSLVCDSGYADCDGVRTNGCESSAHVNGPADAVVAGYQLGQAYCNAAPAGVPGDAATYTSALAAAARAAAPAGTDGNLTCIVASNSAQCLKRTIGGNCYVWCYENAGPTQLAGRVVKTTTCGCPSSGSPSWH